MKKLLILFVAFFYFQGYSQSLKIVYSEKRILSQERLDAMPTDVREATLAKMKVPNLFTLEYSDGVSLYQRDKDASDFIFEKSGSSTNEDGSLVESKIVANIKITPFFYYKELKNDLLLFKLTNSQIEFDGKDKLLSWNWEITNETKVISGYNCKKAISKAFDGYFVAWFTEDIPVNAGPEKFDGLPGLILYISNTGQEFIAEKIDVLKSKIDIKKPIIPLKTVTVLEMYDISSRKSYDFKNTKTIKQGNTTIKTESY